MKVTVNKIANGNKALELIAEKEFPAKASYWISQFELNTKDSYKSFNSTRNNLLAKYGTAPIDDPNYFTIPNENIQKFNDELNEVLKTEEEILVNTISISAFGDQIIPKDFFVLMEGFITE